MCGEHLTLADIIIYNELSMFLELTKQKWTSPDMKELPNLVRWATEHIGKRQDIKALDDSMKEELKKISSAK